MESCFSVFPVSPVALPVTVTNVVSAGTTPKKWDPGVTALYTTPESDL